MLTHLQWYGWLIFGATVFDILLVVEALSTKTLNHRHLLTTAVLITLTTWLIAG